MKYTYIYASILYLSCKPRNTRIFMQVYYTSLVHYNFSVFQADIEPENQLYPTRSIDVDYQHI